MNNLKIIQEFSRTPENIQGQQDVFQESRAKRVLIANSRQFLALKDVWQPYMRLIHRAGFTPLVFILYIAGYDNKFNIMIKVI